VDWLRACEILDRATLGGQRRIDRLRRQYRSPEQGAAFERQQWRGRLGNADADKCRIGPRQGAKRTGVVAAIPAPWPYRHAAHRCSTDTGSGRADFSVARQGGSTGSTELRRLHFGIAGSGRPRAVIQDPAEPQPHHGVPGGPQLGRFVCIIAAIAGYSRPAWCAGRSEGALLHTYRVQ
jgi:hypothetical protein